MKPPPFQYVAAASMPQALEVLTDYGEEAKVLAGGQSLVPLLNMRLAQPRVLVDLNRMRELQYMIPRSDDGRPGVALGAMTRQSDVERAGEVLNIPLVREAVGWVGHPQIRSRGTIGGSIAHADPSAELPLVFCALDGVGTARSQRGSRTIPATEFFVYTFTTALEPDEVLEDVWLPSPAPRTGQAFVETARRHGDFALVAVAASLTLEEAYHCSDARIAVGGAAPTPLRARAAEEVVRGERVSLNLFREAARIAAREMEPTSDIHADAEYRRELAGVLVYRALKTAYERVPGGER